MTDDEMATLAPDSPPSSPSFHFRRKSWARRVERACCTTLSYFPLTFVYGLTTWAVWVEVTASLLGGPNWLGYLTAALGVLLYGSANTSYTIAVFTNPGSPLDPRDDLSHRGKSRHTGAVYEGLPTHEHYDEDDSRTQAAHGPMTTVTAKSTGQPRYCKKCRCVKPDRAHHCSSCKRCVLKMDHHCPWLATCVGLRNYKPFLLFLIYTSLFCWLCFAVSARWVWRAIVADEHMEESMRVVNCVMLAVLGGIIGLVLSGFTAWHLYLSVTGQTTIESLEKTRYLTPLRKQLAPQPHVERHYLADEEEGETGPERGLLEQLKTTHANALPGILRPEEGEDSASRSITPEPPIPRPSNADSPAKSALQRNYASLEAQRERERYDAYLDERDSEKLPNAFDQGWRRNLCHVFGDAPLLWALPICNTSGDGWMWEVSPKWVAARADLGKEREAREREEAVWRQEGQEWGARSSRPPPPPPPSARRDLRWTPGQGFVGQSGQFPNGGARDMPLQPLDRRKSGDPGGRHRVDEDGVDVYDTSSDEEAVSSRRYVVGGRGNPVATANWNDIPDDFLSSKRNGGSRSRSPGRRKGD